MYVPSTHATAIVIVAALAVGCNQQSIALLPDRARTPPAIRDACSLTEQKCSRCHDLERILLAHWALVDWGTYVDRMRRQPGSGITVDDSKIILTCLNHLKQLQQSRDLSLRAPTFGRPAPVACGEVGLLEPRD